MKPVIFALHGQDMLGAALAALIGGETGDLVTRRFPDGESYVRLDTPVAGRAAVLVCDLRDPDSKIPQICFAAAAAKELGATCTGLVAPYLAYMRQDRRFQPGEAVTSASFARLIGGFADWLVTVDPHLHRYGSLGEIYAIPATVVRAAPAIARWIRKNIASPWVIGPDTESAQWVSDIAGDTGAPYTVLKKIRRGDRDVEVSLPDIDTHRARTPVIVDDIISTGHTMIAAMAHLKRAGLAPPVCIGVHAVFADRAHENLLAAGAARVVTCNTITHPSNGINLGEQIAAAVQQQVLRNAGGTDPAAPR